MMILMMVLMIILKIIVIIIIMLEIYKWRPLTAGVTPVILVASGAGVSAR